MEQFLSFLDGGLLNFPWWALLLLTYLLTQLSVMAVTLYLHRAMAHRGLDLHPLAEHLARFWLWFTTATVTAEWVAIHRKHHARCESEEDPHSPVAFGIGRVLFRGAVLYGQARKNREMVARYSHGCPDDWVERNIYTPRSHWGPTLLLFIEVALFGVLGLTMWALQMIFMPLFAAGVINGLGHWVGYRNHATDDRSHNLLPWGFFLGGEELHNNHHAFPTSAKFASRRFEFDAGWVTIRMLQATGLAKIRRVAPTLVRSRERAVSPDTFRAIFAHRFGVLQAYCREVMIPVAASNVTGFGRRARSALLRNNRFLKSRKKKALAHAILTHPKLETIVSFRDRLHALWDRSSHCPEVLTSRLENWILEAEQSGIEALAHFASRLRSYRLAHD